MREKELEKIKEYKYGFSTDIENIRAPKGLNKEVIKFISNIKKEPKWMLDWRLKAYDRLQHLKEPDWQKPKYPKIDYQNLYYYSATKSIKDKPKSLDDLDPKLLETYNKLGIALVEQKRLNNIVTSIRGTNGGYVLSNDPNQIKLSSIFLAVDEKVKQVQCKKESKKGCNGKSSKCITHYLWDELEVYINDFFEKKNLGDLLKNNLEMKVER